MTNPVTFHLYRYHLNPLVSNSNQIELYPNVELEPDQIRENKNKFFASALESILDKATASNPMALVDNDNEWYLYKIANIKKRKVTKEFKKLQIDDEPYVYVIINNDPDIQKIAVSENGDAFTSPDTVKNLINRIFKRELAKFGLSIEIDKLFDVKDFWAYTDKYKDRIQRVDFEFIKPNLAKISASLPEAFRNFQEKTNGHRGKVMIQAPEEGVLENINQSNPEVKGLVDYSSEGGGNVSLKIKGIRKWKHTEEKPVTLQIDEASLEGAPEQVFKLYKAIIND